MAAKKSTTKKKTTTRKKAPSGKKKAPSRKKKTSSGGATSASGKKLVIVESPAKAKTINRYLGPDYVVEASVGHVRDLPSRAPKGTKQPVPGVDLEHDFEPTYEVLADKKKQVDKLRRLARQAEEIWFATDLDREGEAIAWHLAEILGVDPVTARRVVFNAITKDEIARAFDNPHSIDVDKVNAQQARRILDRIVGYQVSPLLWKKVARGLSAGRVQSVAVRLVVEREREIRAFVPDEYWDVEVQLALDPSAAVGLGPQWTEFLAQRSDKGLGPNKAKRNGWLADHDAFTASLIEVGGSKFEVRRSAEDHGRMVENGEDPGLETDIQRVAEQVGLSEVSLDVTEDPDGKGPATRLVRVGGVIAPTVRYAAKSIEATRVKDRPRAPFITSTLQRAASTAYGFGAQRTMRAAQRLYEGVELPGVGQVGLITYMRTDSTHLSGAALNEVRDHIGSTFGERYLPDKPNFFGSSNKSAQEAHEAIRPTSALRHPDEVARQAKKLGEDEKRLYDLIWRRFVACQMAHAEWDQTTILLERSDKPTGAVLRTSGRTLAFDGYLKVLGRTAKADEQTLPALAERDETAPFSIEPTQRFTSPPRRFSEAALIEKLEKEGIGRPSTYASIISVIQDRNYVELVNKAFHATDLGEVVTDKLIEGFPKLMDLGYTREMEGELDRVAEQHHDWVQMLRDFYGPFAQALDSAHETMTHAKAEIQPAIYACPDCGHRCCYRFGKNGRFLSCTNYPDCTFAAPIDRQGRPMLTERVDVAGPDGKPMELRTGRFGKFIAPHAYGKDKKDKARDAELKASILNLDKKGGLKYQSQPPVVTDLVCEKCGEPLAVRRGKNNRPPWLGCTGFPKCRGRGSWAGLDEAKQAELEKALDVNDRENPVRVPARASTGEAIPEGTPVADLVIEGEMQDLPIHPEAAAELEAAEKARGSGKASGGQAA
jgi:DNA topoisomerase-1